MYRRRMVLCMFLLGASAAKTQAASVERAEIVLQGSPEILLQVHFRDGYMAPPGDRLLVEEATIVRLRRPLFKGATYLERKRALDGAGLLTARFWERTLPPGADLLPGDIVEMKLSVGGRALGSLGALVRKGAPASPGVTVPEPVTPSPSPSPTATQPPPVVSTSTPVPTRLPEAEPSPVPIPGGVPQESATVTVSPTATRSAGSFVVVLRDGRRIESRGRPELRAGGIFSSNAYLVRPLTGPPFLINTGLVDAVRTELENRSAFGPNAALPLPSPSPTAEVSATAIAAADSITPVGPPPVSSEDSVPTTSAASDAGVRTPPQAPTVVASNPGTANRLPSRRALTYSLGGVSLVVATGLVLLGLRRRKAARESTEIFGLGIRPAIEDLRISKLVAVGGFCEIYLARTPSGDQRVLKVLKAEFRSSKSMSAALLEEADILQRLNDLYPRVPIVKIRGRGVFNDAGVVHPYLILEHVPGENLRDLVMRSGALSHTEAVRAVSDVASALIAVHRLGYVHGDVTPENLIRSTNGAGSRCCLIDFGTARANIAEERVEEIAGKLLFLSPEQCDHFPPTPESDIYSLGMVFYYLYVGRHAFDRENAVEVLHLHKTARVAYPPEVPAGVVVLIDRMVQKLPISRPTAREVLEELEGLRPGGV